MGGIFAMLAAQAAPAAGSIWTGTESIDLLGSNEHLVGTDSYDSDGATAVSWTIVAKWDTVVGVQALFTKIASGAGTAPGWMLQSNGTSLRFWLNTAAGASGRIFVTTSGVISAGVWYHICVTWDGVDAAGFAIYVDAVSKSLTLTTDTDTTASGGPANSEPVRIGAHGSGLYFNGHIYEAYIDEIELSGAQVSTRNTALREDLSISGLIPAWYVQPGSTGDSETGTIANIISPGTDDMTATNTAAGALTTDIPNP